MSEAYSRVRAGRLAFKGGELATRDKPIDKKKHKKNKNKHKHKHAADTAQQLPDNDPTITLVDSTSAPAPAPDDIYSIDAAKKMKYEDLFPVETKKFGYDPNAAKSKSVAEALDDRVKKKADRYCK